VINHGLYDNLVHNKLTENSYGGKGINWPLKTMFSSSNGRCVLSLRSTACHV